MLEFPWRKVLARAFASSRYEGQELAGIITSIIDKDVYGSPLVKSLQRLDSMNRLSPQRISIQKCEKCSANIHGRTAGKESHRFKKSIHISLLGHISATNQSRSPKIFNLHTNQDPLKSGSKGQNVSAWLHNWRTLVVMKAPLIRSGCNRQCSFQEWRTNLLRYFFRFFGRPRIVHKYLSCKHEARITTFSFKGTQEKTSPIFFLYERSVCHIPANFTRKP